MRQNRRQAQRVRNGQLRNGPKSPLSEHSRKMDNRAWSRSAATLHQGIGVFAGPPSAIPESDHERGQNTCTDRRYTTRKVETRGGDSAPHCSSPVRPGCPLLWETGRETTKLRKFCGPRSHFRPRRTVFALGIRERRGRVAFRLPGGPV